MGEEALVVSPGTAGGDVSSPARTERGGAALRLPYLPGLDGLRAIAVGAVLLYHAGVTWLPGGFLGVEVFFVISGYLITALLATEWRAHGRLDLGTFWFRRARRLLPAIVLLLLVVLVYAVLFLPSEVARLRGDSLAALAYATNWYFIFRQQSYFEAIGRPSLLQHLWSLAIEEQFYVIWPPVLLLLLRRWEQRRIALILLGVAACSTLLMALLYRAEVDPSRVYYGTDTRAAGLLLGSALALAWAPWRSATRIATALAVRLDVAGLGALGVLLLCFVGFDQRQDFLYRGGFAIVALATATVIAGSVVPGARLLPGLLELPPLRWLGERSYSLYLWHWPIFTTTRPMIDLRMEGLPLFVLRFALTLLVADLSYRFVETPIRRGALGRSWQGLRRLWRSSERRSWRLVQLGSVGSGALVGFALALGIAVASAQPPPPDATFGSGTVELNVPTAVPAQGIGGEMEPPAPALVANTVPALPMAPAPCAPQLRKPLMTALGDSVMVAGAENMAEFVGEGLYISAEVGRQAAQYPALLGARRDAGELGTIVIIHVGNNGYVTEKHFNAIMAELKDARAVLFFNVRVPREWESNNNAVLTAGVARYRNAVLLDWYGASAGHPEYLKDDGVHPIAKGRAIYAALVSTEIEAIKARWASEGGCTLGGTTVPSAPVAYQRQSPQR